jgi:hypothetical protein
MSKQTAVEWLIIKDSQATIDFIEGKITSLELAVKKATFIEQAKAMEKEQMCQFAFDYQDEFFNNGKVLPIEQYYNETYGEPNKLTNDK